MKTILTRSTTEAAGLIKRGGVVAFPTETVYGLGADVFDEEAIGKIFEAKNRPSDNPLIVHIDERSRIGDLATGITRSADRLIDAFFPGPLTIVLPKASQVPLIATAGLDSIGIRMPRNINAQEFLRACAVPVVAPSANLSGRPSPTTWQAVLEDLEGRIDGILQGEPAEIGLESTVVDCTSAIPLLLRKGAISLERLREVIPALRLAGPQDVERSRSPGLKHKHYSPLAAVILIDNAEAYALTSEDAYIGVTPRSNLARISKICESVDEYAASLFEFFRECDRSNIRRIFCEGVSEDGIGAALMDRIRRAAATALI